MARTLVREPAGASAPAGPPGRRGGARGARSSRRPPRRGALAPILLQLAAMLGIGALLYPTAADWFASLRHDAEISGYVQAVEQMPDAERRDLLAAAREYNARLPSGVLRDPYAEPAGAAPRGDGGAAEDALPASGADGGGAIGRLSYPRLDIGLPVFHGTSDEVLRQGVGHLLGSSLPVGGESSHALLTSHSGLVHAKLFSRLPQAEVGDTFHISVLGETLSYRVDRLETILPEQTEGLGIVPGEDRVTLITCTPIGVNSHRLLVHGVRVDAPPTAEARTLGGDGAGVGAPWWALVFVAGSAVTAYLLFAPRRAARGVGARKAASAAQPRPRLEVGAADGRAAPRL